MAVDLGTLEKTYDLPAGLLAAVQNKEDPGADPSATSAAGAIGPFQFMPETAKAYGVSDPTNYDQAAVGAAKMFSDLKDQYNGDVPSMLAAYNWGSGNVDKHGLEKAPAETKDYVSSIMGKIGGAIMPTANAAEATDQAPSKMSPEQLLVTGDKLNVQPRQPQTAEQMLSKLLGEDATAPAGGSAAPLKAEDMLDGLLKQPVEDKTQQPKLNATNQNGGTAGSQKNGAVGNPQGNSPDKIEQAIRQTGLTSRDLLEVATSPITSLGDILNTTINGATSGLNKLAGLNIPQLGMPSDSVTKGLDAVGLPKPQSTSEKMGSAATQVAGSASMLGENLLPLAKEGYSEALNLWQKYRGGNVLGADDVKGLAGQAYKAAADKGGILTPDFTNKFIDKATEAMPQSPEGKIVTGENPVTQFVGRLQGLKDKPLTLAGVQDIDEHLGDLIDAEHDVTGISKQGVRLQKIQGTLRNMISTATPEQVVGGTQGFDALNSGRQLWSQAAKMSDVERAMAKPNPQTALNNLYNNSSKTRGWNDQELSALKSASQTGVGTGLLKLVGSKFVPYIASIIGEMAGGVGEAAIAGGAAHVVSSGARNAAAAVQAGKAKNVIKVLNKRLPSLSNLPDQQP